MPSDSNTGTTSIVGTISMFADQMATINLNYTVPTGGESPPPVATMSIDDPTLATVTISPPTGVNILGSIVQQSVITILGLGVAGSSTIHASEEGQDDSDIALVLIARPLDTVTFDTSSTTITNAPGIVLASAVVSNTSASPASVDAASTLVSTATDASGTDVTSVDGPSTFTTSDPGPTASTATISNTGTVIVTGTSPPGNQVHGTDAQPTNTPGMAGPSATLS